jgi:galactokinase
VPRGFALAARERQDQRVVVADGRTDEVTVVDLDAEERPVRGWRAYVAVAARRLARNFPGASLGTDIAFVSDLPRAAGLSSSSALIVGVVEALVRRGEIEAREEWRREIRSTEARAEYLGTVENGHSYGTLEGARGVGTQGGSEDHAAILMGETGALQQFQFVPMRRLGAVPVPPSWSFVIMSSGVHADKAGSVRDRYNRAARAARVILETWNAKTAGASPSLAAALASGADATGEILRALASVPHPDFTAKDLGDRLAHFVREDARVAEAAAAFARSDAAALGMLAAASQEEAASLLGNQVPETVNLVQAAVASGAYAASSFGAGFGGCAWAIVSAADASEFGEAWMTAYRRRHPARQEAQWFSARPSPGLLAV